MDITIPPIVQETSPIQDPPVSPLPQAVADVARWYIFRERQEVVNFLTEHEKAANALLAAYPRLQGYFPHAPIYLEVKADYDAPEERFYLLASIETNLSPDEALKRLAGFDDVWWLDRPDDLHDLLLFSLE
ncbi:MAG TPA: hypothetical protein VKQ36_04015 [Ktedonobacterales bacterium]|nr:hypothetical protein [Ktedonobacterales bacterium]